MPRPFIRSTSLPRLLLRVARAPLCAALVLACGTDPIVSPTEPVTGPGTVYALASTNGINLPASFAQEEAAYIVRKGALTLGTDSSFIFSLALQSRVGTGPTANNTATVRGTFTRTGSAITLLQRGDTMFVGSYAATSIALQRGLAQVPGSQFAFSR